MSRPSSSRRDSGRTVNRLAPRLLVALLAAGSVAAGGCGDDEGGSRGTAAERPPPSAVESIRVDGNRADAGDAVKVTATVKADKAGDSRPPSISYFLSLDRERGRDDVKLSGTAVADGESVRAEPRIPESARSGAYRLLACAGGCTASEERVLVAGSNDLPDGAERLIAVGDIAHCPVSSDEDVAALVGLLPGTLAVLGDNVYETGTAEEFERCYEPAWGGYKDRTRPAVGNHEYGKGNADAYFAYFGEAAGEPGKGWYSYDLGAWHVVVLNSNCDHIGGCAPDSAQVKWLEKDLKDSDADCTLAYFHHARFSSGSEHGNNEDVAPFWDVLQGAGADVVLSAHDHHYERFAPQDPSGVLGTNGMREFVVGTGGKQFYDLAEPQPNSDYRDNKTHGVLELILKPDGYDWRFLPAAGGDATDSGSDSCRTG